MDELFIIIVLTIGLIIVLAGRYLGGFLFPWEFRKVSPKVKTTSQALVECLNKLEDGDEMNMVMGEMASFVVEPREVLNAFKRALKKDISINIISGPVDKNTIKADFHNILENPKIKLYQTDERPKKHFRVIMKKNIVCKEEYHLPGVDNGHRMASSRILAKEYMKIFTEYLENADLIKTVKELKIRGDNI